MINILDENKDKDEHINKKINLKIILIILSILVIQAGAGYTTYYFLEERDNKIIKNKMEEISSNIINSIEEEIYVIEYILHRSSAFFRNYGIYMPLETFVDLLQLEFSPSINYVESHLWILKLKDNEVSDFEPFCSRFISPNCTIKQLNYTALPNITFEQVNGRPFYYPLIFAHPPFLEPLQSFLIGFDLNSADSTFSIINTIDNKTNFVTTNRVRLTRPDPTNPFNFGVISSVASEFIFIDFEQRQKKEIIGFSAATIKIGDVFNHAINSLNLSVIREDIDLFSFDVTVDNIVNNKTNNISLLYKENKSAYINIWFSDDIAEDYNTLKFNFSTGERQWIFYFKYSNDFTTKSRSNLIIILPCTICAIFILIDIIVGVLYQYFESLKQRNIIEKNKNYLANQMLNYVNHEIRNPLNVIKGLIGFILDNMKSIIEDAKSEVININKNSFEIIISDLSTASGSCDMGLHIVNDILDITKLEKGKLELANKVTNIDEFIKDLIKTVSQKIDEKQTIKLQKLYDPTMTLYFDPYRLKQILLNYLTNSIKFTEQGHIIIKIEELGDKIRFSVIDTGRGIPDIAKKNIFQRYIQASPEDSSRHGGYGLGLYLCKIIAERMNGQTGFESQFGKGSTFWVEFPVSLIKPLEVRINYNKV